MGGGGGRGIRVLREGGGEGFGGEKGAGAGNGGGCDLGKILGIICAVGGENII